MIVYMENLRTGKSSTELISDSSEPLGSNCFFYIQAINNCNLKFENTAPIYNSTTKKEIFLYKSYKIHRGSKNRTSQNTGRRSQRKYKGKDILCSCVCVEVSPVMPNSLRSYRLYPARLPCSHGSPGKSTGHRLPCSSPEGSSDTGVHCTSLKFPALADGFFHYYRHLGKPPCSE